MEKYSLRRKYILLFSKALFIGIFSHPAHAGLEEACWTDPLQIVFLSNGRLITLQPPKKEAEGVISFDYTPGYFSAKCNNSYDHERSGMFIEAELGPYFIPSQVNSGYYRLSDGVDAKMGLANGDGNLTYPIKLEERTLLRDAPTGLNRDKGLFMISLDLWFTYRCALS